MKEYKITEDFELGGYGFYKDAIINEEYEVTCKYYSSRDKCSKFIIDKRYFPILKKMFKKKICFEEIKEPTPAEKFFKKWEGKKFWNRVFDANIDYIKVTGILNDDLFDVDVYKNDKKIFSGRWMIHENNFDDYTEYKGKELVWRVPKEGEEHYCINQTGYINECKVISQIDNKMVSVGNLCIKKEPLEHELLLRQLRIKYNQFHEREDNNIDGGYHLQLLYDSTLMGICYTNNKSDITTFFFSSRVKAQQFFKENRELYSKLYKIDNLKVAGED